VEKDREFENTGMVKEILDSREETRIEKDFNGRNGFASADNEDFNGRNGLASADSEVFDGRNGLASADSE